MKPARPKRFRNAGIAAAVSAMLFCGVSLSGCKNSKTQTSSDDEKISVVEERDLVTGKPYKIKAARRLQDLRSEHGELMTVNPVTGESACQIDADRLNKTCILPSAAAKDKRFMFRSIRPAADMRFSGRHSDLKSGKAL